MTFLSELGTAVTGSLMDPFMLIPVILIGYTATTLWLRTILVLVVASIISTLIAVMLGKASVLPSDVASFWLAGIIGRTAIGLTIAEAIARIRTRLRLAEE